MDTSKYLKDVAVLWVLSGKNVYGELTFVGGVEVDVVGYKKVPSRYGSSS